MYGRKIGDNLRPGTPMHLYLPGPHRGVGNEEALEASREVILCEALIDGLTFWCAEYRNEAGDKAAAALAGPETLGYLSFNGSNQWFTGWTQFVAP